MDIKIIGHTSGLPKGSVTDIIDGCRFVVEHHYRRELEDILLIPREIEYSELERHENPNYPRSRFVIKMRDVSQKASEFGTVPEIGYVAEEEFLFNIKEKHKLCYYPLLNFKNRKNTGNCAFWLDAVVIGDQIVGGNDPTVIWDGERFNTDF